jgi:hypothetical protein
MRHYRQCLSIDENMSFLLGVTAQSFLNSKSNMHPIAKGDEQGNRPEKKNADIRKDVACTAFKMGSEYFTETVWLNWC